MRSAKQEKGFVGSLRHVVQVYPFAAVMGNATSQFVGEHMRMQVICSGE